MHPFLDLKSVSATRQDDAFWQRRKPLPRTFFRSEAESVAPDLLGQILVTSFGGTVVAGVIVEVEAYLGVSDAASHAYRAVTERNRMMFAEGGLSYVYLSYGMHYCMNVVTGPEGQGEAVLLRAVAPIYNARAMARRRGINLQNKTKLPVTLSNGPGKLCQAFGVDQGQYGWAFNRPDFKIVPALAPLAAGTIGRSPRIGISKAKDLMLRFFVKDSPFVSKAKFPGSSTL